MGSSILSVSSGRLVFRRLAKTSLGLRDVSKVQCLCLGTLFYKMTSKSGIGRCLIICINVDNALSHYFAVLSPAIPASSSRTSSVALVQLIIGHIKVSCRFSELGASKSCSLIEVRPLWIYNPTAALVFLCVQGSDLSHNLIPRSLFCYQHKYI